MPPAPADGSHAARATPLKVRSPRATLRLAIDTHAVSPSRVSSGARSARSSAARGSSASVAARSSLRRGSSSRASAARVSPGSSASARPASFSASAYASSNVGSGLAARFFGPSGLSDSGASVSCSWPATSRGLTELASWTISQTAPAVRARPTSSIPATDSGFSPAGGRRNASSES